ncbi:hypothetical protein ACQ86N_48300 [Puia sp. P3]|uniref:hypothetical protein n=1 Tax=Puia sp. P3 TaxID=3423952 RepID=UPI003D672D1E
MGYLVGRAKIYKTEDKLRKLETELLSSHQETLESQRALVELESRVQQSRGSPVIPMKINPSKETKEKATK